MECQLFIKAQILKFNLKHSDDVFITLINFKMPIFVGTDFNVYEQDKFHALLIWAWKGLITSNQFSGFATKPDSNQPAQLQGLAKYLIFVCNKWRYIILFRKRKTKTQTRLRGCAGWSASLLFACNSQIFLLLCPSVVHEEATNACWSQACNCKKDSDWRKR